MTAVTQAGVQSFLNSFLGKARVSIAEKSEQAVLLPDGTYVEAWAAYGTVKVKVEVPVKPVDQDNPSPDFFGGIVFQLRYYPTESVFFGPGIPDEEAASTLVPEVASRGAIIGKSGRPAVPGVGKTEATDWLVVQVARNKPLSVDPVGTGAVKIFRITDPKVGRYCEVNSTPGTYLLSANNTLSEFYICGKLAEFLPPLPLTDADREMLDAMDSMTGVRIRTHKFVPPSFVRAGKTHGFVFVAVAKKLFGINTRDRPLSGVATWKLLHTAFFDSLPRYINDFGTTFTTATSPAGATTITCSGSNGAGVCSGFAVTLTPGAGMAPPALAGVLSLMHDASVAAVAATLVSTSVLTINGTVVVSSTPLGVPVAWRVGSITYSVTTELSGGNKELRTDRLTGERGTLQANETLSTTTESELTSGFLSWTSGDSAVFNSTRFITHHLQTSGPGSDNRTTDISYNASGIISTPGGIGDPFSLSTDYVRTMTADTTLAPGGGVVFEREVHVGGVYFRVAKSRSATRTPPSDVTGSPHLESTDPPPEIDSVEVLDYSAMTMSEMLVRRSGTALHEWTDSFARFSTAPAMAGAQTHNVVVTGLKYAMLDPQLYAGPDTPSTSSGGTDSYLYWFPKILLGPARISFEYLSGTVDYGGSVGLFGVAQNASAVGVPLWPLTTTPTGVPGIYSFSGSYSYTQDQPSGYTIADFAAIQPYSAYAYEVDTPGSMPGLSGVTSVNVTPAAPAISGALMTGTGTASLLLAGEHGTTPWLREQREIFYDLRTGGFIAESLIKAEISPGVWESSLETLIGNDHGVVPLRPVIDAWRALGQLDGATNDKRILISGSARVSLL